MTGPIRDADYWKTRCDEAEQQVEGMQSLTQRLIHFILASPHPTEMDTVINRLVSTGLVERK